MIFASKWARCLHLGALTAIGAALVPACASTSLTTDASLTASAMPIAAQDWVMEAESGAARVSFEGGVIDIDTPAGLTLWFKEDLSAPVTISFEVMAVSEGGANDYGSDINAFWMARNSDGSSILTSARSGAFTDYDTMLSYYVGIGGNRNSTTRMRRYIGTVGDRPLLAGHDRSDPAALITPNQWTKIRLVAQGNQFAVERDGERLFTYDFAHTAQAYMRGHFGLRTTKSHLRFRNISIGEGNVE